MHDLHERYAAASKNAQRQVFGHRRRTPAEVFTQLAQVCTELGIDEWDTYGDGGAVTLLEEEVADLLGKPAAAFFPSGTMGQQAILRVWAEEAGTKRVALPALSHLLVHELDGPRLLHGFEFVQLCTGRRVPNRADLDAHATRLAAVLVEVPLRDAGCLVEPWADFLELAAAARARGIRVHVDGARLWEVAAYLDQPPAQLVAPADSVYVSFYKGLGGSAGAAVASSAEAIAQARQWRKRMGGTLARLTPYAVGGLLGLRTHLPRMVDYLAWARDLAVALEGQGFRVNPAAPQGNTFEVYADVSPEMVNERLLDFAARTGTLLSRPWGATDVPGHSRAELVVLAPALDFDAEVVARWLAECAFGGAER